MNPDQLLEEELNKVDLYFTSCRNSEKTEKLPCFFRMAFHKNYDVSRKFNGTSFFENFRYEDKESSLEEVRKGMQAFGGTGMAYVKISLLSSATSNNNHVCVVKNPYYQGGAGIGGLGQNTGFSQNSNFMYQQSQQSLLMQMQKANFEQQLAFQKEMAELRHEQALRDKQDEIDYLEDGRKSTIAKIGELSQSPAILPLTQALAGFITDLTANQSPPQVQQPQPAPLAQQAQQQSDQAQHTDEAEAAGNRIKSSIEKISTVFPDYLNFLESMSDYVVTNPELAKSVFASQQTQ